MAFQLPAERHGRGRSFTRVFTHGDQRQNESPIELRSGIGSCGGEDRKSFGMQLQPLHVRDGTHSMNIVRAG